MGVYPDVSLKSTRDRRAEAKTQLADGINPLERSAHPSYLLYYAVSRTGEPWRQPIAYTKAAARYSAMPSPLVGRNVRDPSADLKGALPPTRQKHHASITDPKKIGELL